MNRSLFSKQISVPSRKRKNIMKKKKGLYANINARKKKGISRSKKNSTISKEAYENMKKGFPSKKKGKKK